MRPAALPHVANPYGWLHAPLSKGDVIKVTIASNFPSKPLNAYKMLVLTEFGIMGGRHDGFGLMLIACGFLCMILAGLSVCITKSVEPGKGFHKRCQNYFDPLAADVKVRKKSRGMSIIERGSLFRASAR